MRLTTFYRAGRGLLGLAGGMALTACSGGSREPRHDLTEAVAQRQASAVRPTAVYPLVDLPPALHLRLAEFKTHFGRAQPLPAGFVDPGKGPASPENVDSAVLFRPHGLPMVVSYHTGTGIVADVLLLGADESTLMRQATLLPNAAGYLALPVFEAQHTTRLLGLRVIPK